MEIGLMLTIILKGIARGLFGWSIITAINHPDTWWVYILLGATGALGWI